MTRQVVLDTETTGLYADGGDRIVELGCIEMVNRKLTGRNLHHYLNPQRPSHPEALKVHGLTEEFLADKPVFEAIADAFLQFVEGAELLIHNASFDTAFLDAELARLGKPSVTKHAAGVLDTLVMAREMFPGKGNSLDALCKRFEVDNSNRALHGALLDASLLAEVYLRMTRGQDSLMIESSAEGDAAATQDSVDFAALQLRVRYADTDEVRAHDKMIATIDAISGGKAVWKAAMA